MKAQRGPVVGIIGGGQLARMLAEAATPLGIHVRVLAGAADEGAPEVVPDTVVGAADDPAAVVAFGRSVDVVTLDHENVDHGALDELARSGVAVWPAVETLRFADKAWQRRRFAEAGIPVPDFVVIDPAGPGGIEAARSTASSFAADHPGGVVAKASRGGYDGRAVWMLEAAAVTDFVAGWVDAPLVLEPRLALDDEVAVLVARRPSGEVRTWPVLRTVQEGGMCVEVDLPSGLDPVLAAEAEALGRVVAETTGAVGVLAVELFVVDGRLLVNEIAPRVHNSGHVTIEGARTSQFEQHLRAVLDWPLGPTDAVAAAAVMVNVVGGDEGDPRDHQAAALAAVPEAHLHLYGKTARPGRKVGHVTVVGTDLDRCRTRATTVARLLSGVGTSELDVGAPPSGMGGSTT